MQWKSNIFLKIYYPANVGSKHSFSAEPVSQILINRGQVSCFSEKEK